jgi:Domain of unknown function (DUF3576)
VQLCHTWHCRPGHPGGPVAAQACGQWGKSLGRAFTAGYRTATGMGNRMTISHTSRMFCLVALGFSLAGCGGGLSSGDSGLFGGNRRAAAAAPVDPTQAASERAALARSGNADTGQSTIWDLFTNADDPNTTVEVNKYLWVAALDVLNFLPIESVDPFTGVIVTGYGTPPGSGRSYRATIYVQDPALDARSLRVALQSRGGGAVAPEVQRAVEDAILTRARQLRIQDSKL